MQVRPADAVQQLAPYHLQSDTRGRLGRAPGLGWVSSTMFTATVSSGSETCPSKEFSERLAGHLGDFSNLPEE